MINAHHDLLARISVGDPRTPVPTGRELADHLDGRIAVVGETALSEFAYVQQVAARTWGADRTAQFARVLRNARVTRKESRKTIRRRASDILGRLPDPWRDAMARRMERSCQTLSAAGSAAWSADYTMAVAFALRRWVEYAAGAGEPLVPGGASLDRYGSWLVDAGRPGKPVTLRTASDYLTRIHAGLVVVAPGSTSFAREFVIRDWRERADLVGSTTKTGAQLVGASTLYALGLDMMQEARSRPMRGLHAAKDFRNGLILAVGAALPQRARALSVLDFEGSLSLVGGDAIHIRLPAAMLKLPEAEKGGEPLDLRFHNACLADALTEYRHVFRPLFDDGSCLFPSLHAIGRPISEQQIGKLAGDITKRALGVRISIHRMRDNVATEASEHLEGGRLASKVLLGHADIATGDHYDHSDGMRATREYGDFIERRRSLPVELDL